MRPSRCCREKHDPSVKTISFHSAAHIFLSWHHWRRRRLWFCVKGREAMDVLRTDHFAVNGVEWYAQTLDDALQIECAVLWFVTWLNDPSPPCAQFTCHHVKWCTEVDAIEHVGLSYPPASNDQISALQLFCFVQHNYQFPLKIIHNLGGPLSFLCRTWILDQKMIAVFYKA